MKDIAKSIFNNYNVEGRIYKSDIYDLCPGIDSISAEEIRTNLEKIRVLTDSEINERTCGTWL